MIVKAFGNISAYSAVVLIDDNCVCSIDNRNYFLECLNYDASDFESSWHYEVIYR